MSKPKTVILLTRAMQEQCFAPEDLDRIAVLTTLDRAREDAIDVAWQEDAIRGAAIAVTGWGSHPITDAMLDAAPGLELLCHSAGSVRWLVDPDAFVSRGIRLCSARRALAVGVAEFVFGLMLVSMKAVWRFHAETSQGRWAHDAVLDFVREPYGAVVGIVGASCVGREMIRLCKMLALDAILLYDPYVDSKEAEALGVVKVELDELMRRSDVISLHTPAIDETRHIINAGNLALMKDHAIFINTARGMNVDEEALIAKLKEGRILACLDVTDPEPPQPDSPLYTLPNCILTPHVAGAIKENTLRQGKLVADQIEAFLAGRPMPGEIDFTLFDRLA